MATLNLRQMPFFSIVFSAASREAAAETLDLDRLYREHFTSLWRMARAMGVAEAALDDVVQEAFVIALRKWETFNGRSQVKTWLTGILINVARNQRRKQRRRTEPLSESLRDSSPDPEVEAQRREVRRRLMTLLSTLPDAQREAWVLCELESMTAREAGEALGVSPNTVSSRLRLARQHIARCAARVASAERGDRVETRR